MDCVFCSIISGALPSNKVYEDDQLIVIEDINPIAKLHYLVIPKDHFATFSEMSVFDAQTIAMVFKKIPAIAESLNITNGYRLVINQGEDAGQTVQHLHIHLLGGQKMDFKV